MSFPAYADYKDSDVPWLGEVPSHWTVAALKRQARLITQRADDRTCPIALENIEGWTGRFLPTKTEFEGEGIAFELGDILYGKLRPYLAKIYVTESRGEAIGDFHVMRPMDQNPNFLSYFLRTKELVSVVDGSTYGSKMPRASWDFLGSLYVACPPLIEQAAIAAFLDRETAKIDVLVAEQVRLIALLKEKRQAVISHAVTKGLNPDAPMKDSGIEWLGQIPAHWDVLPLTRVIAKFVDYRGATPNKVDDGVPLITATQIKNSKIDHSLDPVFITEAEYATRMTRGFPARGDLLLTTEAPLGECALIEDERVAPGQRIILMKMEPDLMISSYLLVHFRSHFGQSELWTRASGSTASGIRADRLRASNVLVPPQEEQKQIVAHINSVTATYECLFAKAGDAITLLQERRAALISAAVTGKIDVRGLAAEAPAMEAA